MTKILGLDLGTNSIGWAIVDTKEDKPLIDKGVVVFPEGVKIEKGTEKSRAAERTDFRGARRIKFRRKLRKYETLKILVEYKMCPLKDEEVEIWRKSNFKTYPNSIDFLDWLKTDDKIIKNPYYFRDQASRKKISSLELGRAFYHIAQRRGFKSNRLEQSDENLISTVKDEIQDKLNETQNPADFQRELDLIFIDYDFKSRKNDELDSTEQNLKRTYNYIIKVLKNKIKNSDFKEFREQKKEINRYINKPENLGVVKGGIKTLSREITDSGCKTLGQYFWKLYQKDRKSLQNKIRSLYTSREEHYETEFDIICNIQEISDEVKIKLKKAIFFQRPLKSQKGLVGKCTLEKNKPRCPVSRPEFEAFRMWSFLNTIKIKTKSDEGMRELSNDEKALLVPKFHRRRATFKFNDLINELTKLHHTEFQHYKKASTPHAALINYDESTTVNGCPVSAALASVLGDNWEQETRSYETVDRNGKNVTRSVDYTDIWHVLFTFGDTKKLFEYATEKLKLDKKSAKAFSKISLPQGYANLSLTAINKILKWLKKGLLYNHAVFMSNLGKVVKPEIWNNENDQKIIATEIGTIIHNHTLEKKKNRALNALIDDYREKPNELQYSKESAPILKRELENKLVLIFGRKKWHRVHKNEEILLTVFEKLREQLNKQAENNIKFPKFVINDRIDQLIIAFLTKKNLIKEENAIKHIFHPSDLNSFKPEIAKTRSGEPYFIGGKMVKILPLPKTESIKNPVLMRVMHKLRKLINHLLTTGVIDNKTCIHIELAREVNDANKRAAYKTWQNRKQLENEEIKNILKEYFREKSKEKYKIGYEDIKKVKIWTEQLTDSNKNPVDIFELTRSNMEMVKKYKLWKEQRGYCIYTGKPIGISELFDDNRFDIEHTIPRSISWDNSMQNVTIADATFNRKIKRNKIPSELDTHQDILARIRHWEIRFNKLRDLINKINTSSIIDKDTKNRMIQKKHLLHFEYKYWHGKYNRFVMKEVKPNFKNSQLVDTGLITRFAKAYLGSVFRTESDRSNVKVVKGSVVAEFRKSWGIQEEYEKKSRANHIHHCIDAITIACMTKSKYDAFTKAWRKEEESLKFISKLSVPIPKPWASFTQDIKQLENEILVVRSFKDKMSNQTRLKLRKRGVPQYKIKFKKNTAGEYKLDNYGNKISLLNSKNKPIFELDENGNKIPIYQEGDTAKGSLHENTFYGAIKQPKRNEGGKIEFDDNGKIITEKNKKGNDKLTFVVRKPLDKLKDTDLSKIVDKKIREITINARKEENELKKKLTRLKSLEKNAEKKSEKDDFKLQISRIQYKIDHELYVIPPKEGKSTYTPIRKVRIKARVTEPLEDFRAFRRKDTLSKHEHKRQYYVQNDGNYCMVLYESLDYSKRYASIINNIDAARYYKSSNRDKNIDHLIPKAKKNFNLRGILKPNVMVLFYKEIPEEIWDLSLKNQLKRLYYVRTMGKDKRITFQHHQEARNDETLKNDYRFKHDKEPEKWLTNGKAKITFTELPIPKFLLSPVNMKMLIENIDFRVGISGKIEKI